MPDFLPRRDGAMLDWARNFYRAVGDVPGHYGVPAAQLDEALAALSVYAAAVATLRTPETQAPPFYAAKHAARRRLEAATRAVVRLVRANAEGVEETGQVDVLFGMGLRPRAARRRRVAPPVEPPTVGLTVSDGGWIDAAVGAATVGTGGRRRGRPGGAAYALLFVHYGPTPPMETGGWQYLAAASRGTLRFTPPAHEPAGTGVWVVACWVSRRAERSAFSRPATTRVPFGRVNLAA